MSTALDELVNFVASTQANELPPAVIERAQVILMDTLGAILAGSRAEEMQNLARLAVRSSATHSSTILNHAERADARWAALVNAAAGTSTELDEGNAYAKGHPAIHVIPAALALGEELDAPGSAVLTAIVLGYEVATRVGEASDLRRAAHPHGTWGTLGAAAAAARLMGMDAAGIAETINIASSLTLATSFQTATEGALVRDLYAGLSNQNGLFAAQLKECGFTGERNGIPIVFGKVISDTFREEALTDELGNRYEILRGYFKKHSCCRYNHAALDALEILRARHPFEPAEVKTVRVESYRQAAMLDDPRPTTTLAARFSVPYAVAIALVRNSTAPAAFDATALKDPEIRSLAERVRVTENPEFTAMTPARRPARVTVDLADGGSLSETVYSSRGDPEQPFTHAELVDKYFELASPVIGKKNAESALALVDRFMQLDSIRPLMEYARGRPE